MVWMRIRRVVGVGVLAASWSGLVAQPPKSIPQAPPVVTVEQPDANRTREELTRLLEHYPPTLKNVFAMDPSLLSNQAYLAPYPALINFLNAHPEIARDASYYVGGSGGSFNRGFRQQETTTSAERVWGRVLDQLVIFAGFALGFGLLAWLIRTFLDYRRWNRLTNVQTEAHTRLLDRFTGNEELLAYIKSPAGSKFLESSPITLDAGPRSVGAPLGRILWSIQAGLVLAAGGIGMEIVVGRVSEEAAQPIHALGVLGIALGLGFVTSAIVSYAISQRLGLIEPAPIRRAEPPATLG
jgi:hypothetical protein